MGFERSLGLSDCERMRDEVMLRRGRWIWMDEDGGRKRRAWRRHCAQTRDDGAIGSLNSMTGPLEKLAIMDVRYSSRELMLLLMK